MLDQIKYINRLLLPEQELWFELFYWGKFKWCAVLEFQNTSWVIAESQSATGIKQLIYSKADQAIYLDNSIATPILKGLHEVLGDLLELSTLFGKEQKTIYIDKRASMHNLLPMSRVWNTGINDPEYFDKPEAYVQLIRECQKLAPDLKVRIQAITQRGEHEKIIHLIINGEEQQLLLDKELFDKKIFSMFNQYLKEERLVHTINENMEMQVLLVNEKQFYELNRRGLLI